jgi:glutamyl-tRNA synthetase
VLHTALRAPPDAEILVDGVNVVPEVVATRRRMARFADAVRSGEMRTPGGRPFTDVVNIGIGGSDLGPAMASVLEYREQGYLPDALLNYLVRLGWSHGDQEIFSRDEMIAAFDVANVQRSMARFDVEKLNWLNQHYIKAAPAARLAQALDEQLAHAGVHAPGAPASLEPLAEAFRERAKTLREMAERARVYVTDEVTYEPKAAAKQLQAAAAPLLCALNEQLTALDAAQWTEEGTQAVVERVAAEAQVGMGKVAQPLRVALTGDSASPGIGTTLVLVGRERTLARIARALAHIESLGAHARQ